MRQRFSVLLMLVMMIALPCRVIGQTGCDDSPESPTLVLALVGASGIFAARLRSIRRR